MPRQILAAKNIHPAVKKKIADNHADIITEVQDAIAKHKVVVVGMAQNPAPKRARKTLDKLGIEHTYLEYGNYFKLWRRRNALKMWTGWPSFPMIFINGTLIGGSSDLTALVEADKLDKLL
ncbi:glutaredoxin [SAR92 clade bacterium H921]|jgi:monothiol glutaredoxin|nr:glutaredoxin [SAR92 clade bacterium H921]MDA9664276.1 glutaredoxin [bacterium]MDG0972066.1 glutaredoxin [Porticoccaceae bacterium]MDG1307291.1 glutaredoxin [Porticoccaceae bacterium]